MNHADHVALLRGGVVGAGRRWADLGSGEGAFTLALAELLGPAGEIHSVDQDRGALDTQRRRLHGAFPGVTVIHALADFTQPLDLPPLDGIVMANSLHFVRDKAPLLRRLLQRLRPGGRFVLVEYDTDEGNQWVPYPLSFPSWVDLASAAGLRDTHLLTSVPSRFLGSIYSAVSLA